MAWTKRRHFYHDVSNGSPVQPPQEPPPRGFGVRSTSDKYPRVDVSGGLCRVQNSTVYKHDYYQGSNRLRVSVTP